MYVIKTFIKLVNFFRSGKNLFGQVNSQTLSDQFSCKVSATFVNTELLMQFYTDLFETLHMFLPWSGDVHVV